MATIKTYTDIEQSKKLAEFLPIESADMFYWCADHYPKEDWIIEVGELDDNYECICAWSLAALLGAVDFITINLFYIDERGYWVVSATIHNSTKLCTKYESAIAFNPVDACYELIIKLHDQKLL